MSGQDVKLLARKIVSLERRHNALAKAQQLPSSSVRLTGGDDASIAGGIETSYDAWDETSSIGENLTDQGDLIDEEASNATEVPSWIEGASEAADIAWDSTQFATDLALTLDTDLTQAKQELEQAKIDLDQALADSAAALQEAQVAVTDSTQAISEAVAAAQAAQGASVEAQLANGRLTLAGAVPVAADGVGKPLGALWMRQVSGDISSMWEWTSLGWVPRPLAESIIPQVAIGAGTYGELDGVRLKAKSITADTVLVGAGQNEVWDGNYTAWNTSAWGNASGGPGSGWSTDVIRPGMTISQKLTEKTAPASTASLYSAMRSGISATSGANLDRAMYVGDRIGEKLVAYAHFYIDKVPPGGMSSISTQVYFYNSANSNFSNQTGGRVNRADVKVGEWMRVGGTQLTVPEGAIYAVVRPTVYYTNNTTDVNGTNYYLGGEEMYWANAGELIVDGAIYAEKLATNAVVADKIASNAVTAVKINAGAVTSEKINAGAVIADKIASNAITADKIAANAITSEKIAATSIDGMNITGAVLRGGEIYGGIFSLETISGLTTIFYDNCNTVTSNWGTFFGDPGVTRNTSTFVSSPASINAGLNPQGWFKGVRRKNINVTMSAPGELTFWVRPTVSQSSIYVESYTNSIEYQRNLPANTWTQVSIPLNQGAKVSSVAVYMGDYYAGDGGGFAIDDLRIVTELNSASVVDIRRLSDGKAVVRSSNYITGQQSLLSEGALQLVTQPPGSPVKSVTTVDSSGITANSEANLSLTNTNSNGFVRVSAGPGGSSSASIVLSPGAGSSPDINFSTSTMHSARSPNILWEGAWFMHGSQVADLSEPVSSQVSGIVLQWQAYSNGALQNHNHNYIFVPKTHVQFNPGQGIRIILRNGGTTLTKYVYVNDSRVNGFTGNETAPNDQLVLSRIIGV